MRKSRTRTLQSAKYLQKKKKKKVMMTSLISAGALILIVIIFLILNTSHLRISVINLTGVRTLDGEEVKASITRTLEGKYLNLIPKNSSFFYSEKKIEKVLQDSYKKIEKIEVKRQGLDTLNVNISENTPVAIVCEGFREEENQEKCFFVDEEAYIFEQATQISDGVFVKYYTNHKTQIGDNFIDKNRFLKLQKFVEDIKNSDVSVAGVLIGDEGSYELYVKNRDESITVVYFDDRTPFDRTSSNFLAFWQSALENKLGTTTTPIFDYINLRFGNNVFYTTR